MNNQWIDCGTPLDLKDARNGDWVAGVCSEAVYGFGWENNQAAATQYVGCRVDSSLMRSLNGARWIQSMLLIAMVFDAKLKR